jgi:hypothetical protein
LENFRKAFLEKMGDELGSGDLIKQLAKSISDAKTQ